ncbi:MAG TPA: SH3 domain-containing protein [Aurantimonas sp.]|jgi:SH3-like domain-containing protein|nr:SH3 domain-containing protein [Aurantimonas sp.]
MLVALLRRSLLALVGAAVLSTGALAPSAPVLAVELGPVSKLPLPRYVSLKAARVNLRIGPGRDYPVSWLYLKPGLPVEVVQEYELWRRIRDSEGTEGWVYHSLLSGERTSIAAPWLKGKATMIDVHANPATDAPLTARLEPGVVAPVTECASGWCRLAVMDRKGFVRQQEIWGVYPDESFQ